MKKVILLAFCLANVYSMFAQHHWCATDVMRKQAIGRNPFLVDAERNYEQLIQDKILELRTNRDGEPEAVLYIPVVFHVIHQYGPENISDEQIFDQMEILNRDFRKLNADTINIVDGLDTLAVDVRVEFRLATKDFLGNCTNGIERIPSIETYVGDNGSKLNQWPRDRYLNVWTVASMENGVAGYSQYPSSVIDNFMARADGVIILHNYIGRIGTGSEGLSRALTHEIGHWLNLSHPWGDNNDPGELCGDDGVEDTPETAGYTTCDLYNFACNSNLFGGVATGQGFNFEQVTTTSGNTDPAASPASFENRVAFSKPRAMGVSSNSEAEGKMAFSNWALGGVDGATTIGEMSGAINLNKYYEITVTPSVGSAMTLTGLSFTVGRDTTGARNYVVRSSVNNYNNNLTASVAPQNAAITISNPNVFFLNQDTEQELIGSRITLTGPQYTKLTGPVTFRIYAWNAEDEDGIFSIDNLSVTGTFGKIENVQNYMDYSYCSVMFTQGQKERMRAALSVAISGRNNLWTDANHQLTGILDYAQECAPIADFYPENRFTCVGEPIQFIDNHTNGEVTSYLWSFPGGNPETSTLENPTVTYDTPGWKAVTLTVGNDLGTNTKTIWEVVRVTPDYSELPSGTLFTEGFDDASSFSTTWVQNNLDNNSSMWTRSNTVGYSNNTCAKLNAFDLDATIIDEGGNDIDELVTPAIDLSNLSGGVFSFKYAFATQSTTSQGISDRLVVYSSNNCGKTWSQRREIDGLDLATAGNFSESFAPNSPLQWATESFNIPNTLDEGTRFKFVFFAGQSPNNLYIDDINITGTVGIDENSDFFGVSLFPNPSDASTQLRFMSLNSEDLQIDMVDLSGRLVKQWLIANPAPGEQNIEINTSQMPKGIYMINLKTANSSSNLKLVVN